MLTFFFFCVSNLQCHFKKHYAPGKWESKKIFVVVSPIEVCHVWCFSRIHPDHRVGRSGGFGNRPAAVSGEVTAVFPAEPVRDVEARTRAPENQRSGSQPPQAVFVHPNPRTYSPAHAAHGTGRWNHTSPVLTLDFWLDVSSLLVLPVAWTFGENLH